MRGVVTADRQEEEKPLGGSGFELALGAAALVISADNAIEPDPPMLGTVTWGAVCAALMTYGWLFDRQIELVTLGLVLFVVIVAGAASVTTFFQRGRLRQLVKLAAPKVSVGPRARCTALSRLRELDSDGTIIPVIDTEVGLCGLVRLDVVRDVPVELRADPLVIVADVMQRTIVVDRELNDTAAAALLRQRDVSALTMVDDDGCCVGFIARRSTTRRRR